MRVYIIAYLCLDIVLGSRVIVVENAPTCFRRVLAGKRALRSHVRRVIPCERLEDCRRECATERRFNCESFNYRLDASTRSQGLCELMTKPIEAFDIRRDFVEDQNYDFYERDRNSLEPHCIDTLRGPGFLHSGFLSSKPANAIPSYEKRWDRRRQGGIRPYERERRPWSDRDRRPYGGRRRHEDRFYVPYQIGQIGSARSNDHEPWSHYGGTYGGKTYYSTEKDYIDVLNYWKPSNFDVSPYPHHVKHITPPDDFDYHSLGHHHHNLGREDHGDGHFVSHNDRTLSHESHDLSHEEHPLSHGDHGLGHDDHGSKPYGYGYGWDKEVLRSGWSGSSSSREVDEPVYVAEKPVYAEYDGSKDCSTQRLAGMSLNSAAIRRSLLARDVVECETACFNEVEFKCVSYSYRYSSSHGADNCFLSERPYKGADMSTDSASDVYGMPNDFGCAVNTGPWVESECFWHVRTGFSLPPPAVQAALEVSGLGACEAECVRAQGFFCRGFTYRSPHSQSPNCLLTSSPASALPPATPSNPGGGVEDALYARGSYGRGCRPHLSVQGSSDCYLQYEHGARLSPSATAGRTTASSAADCAELCKSAPFVCLSYSYHSTAAPGTDNCLFSEVRLFDLQLGVDYELADNNLLYAFDLFNPKCSRKIPQHVPSHPPTGVSAPSGPGYLPEPPSKPSGPQYIPKPEYPGTYITPDRPYDDVSHHHRPHDSKPGFIPSRPYEDRPLGPPPISGPGYLGPSGSGRPYDDRPGFTVNPNDGYDKGVEDPIASVAWGQYTVSGIPCRSGTSCAQNAISGHWACEPEGGEIGSWDYCCAPSHRCGYSEGFHKPWCYVGPRSEQWRPCSDKYYPYHQHPIIHSSHTSHRDPIKGRPEVPWDNRPQSNAYLPSQDDRRPDPIKGRPEVPWDNRPQSNAYLPSQDDRRPGAYSPEPDRQYWDELYKNGPQAYYDQDGNPLPGYSRVPTDSRPHIRVHHRPGPEGGSSWLPVTPPHSSSEEESLDPPMPGGLGVARYWPVAYLHKGPPPNTTYFRYNDSDASTTTENHRHTIQQARLGDFNRSAIETRDRFEHRRDEKPSNVTKEDFNRARESFDNIAKEGFENKAREEFVISVDDRNVTDKIKVDAGKVVNATSEKDKGSLKKNETEDKVDVKERDKDAEVKGISGKIDDFDSIEVLDINEAGGDKQADLKSLEAEERQIEAIGRIVASRRGGGKISLDKRSQKDMEAEHITIDKDIFEDFDFGNRFPTTLERKAQIKRVTKEEALNDRDKSLEVSETTYVRPPRVLATTDNIRKALVNGKVFYDATLREQRDLVVASNRKTKSRQLDDNKAPSVVANNQNAKKKNVRARNANPVRRVRRLYRKRYNPEEVRRRLLERDRAMKEDDDVKKNN